MKIEVLFVGSSIDAETYEGEYAAWGFVDGKLAIYTGATKEAATMVALYPETRLVRVRYV